LPGTLRSLLVDGTERGSCEIAESRAARRKGLLGRDSLQGSFLLVPCRNVHTLGMRFPIDVAYLKRGGRELGSYTVVRTRAMVANRLDRPVLSAHAVLETSAGSFDAWGLSVGSTVEVGP
jgi:uncharacterized protein